MQIDFLSKYSKNTVKEKVIVDNNSDENAQALWLTEDADKYCVLSKLGGKIAFLDPKLEDFCQ